jgi:hypothetical protein
MFVAPYDDPYTIAGQGTIGDEILRQVRRGAGLRGCMAAWLHGCMAAWLHGCPSPGKWAGAGWA